jgi:hypothetical protein
MVAAATEPVAAEAAVSAAAPAVGPVRAFVSAVLDRIFPSRAATQTPAQPVQASFVWSVLAGAGVGAS